MDKINNHNNFRTVRINLFNIGYICFLSAFMLHVSYFVVDYSIGYYFMLSIQFVGYIVLLVKILRQPILKRQLFIIAVISCLLVIVSIQSGSWILLPTFLLVLASKNVNFDKVVKLDVCFRSILTFVIIASSQIGIISNRIEIRTDSVMRQSLGFGHPNRLALDIFIICLYWMYLRYKKYKWYDFLGILLLTIFEVKMTDGRASFYCLIVILVFILINLIFYKISILKRIIEFIVNKSAYVFYFFCVYISFYSAKNFKYNNEIWAFFNKIFNARIDYAYNALHNYGILLGGQKIETITLTEAINTNTMFNGIDNMYLYLGVNFGLIVLVCYLLFVFLILRTAVNNKAEAAGIALIIFSFLSLMENQMLTIESNIFLLLFGTLLYKNNYYFH